MIRNVLRLLVVCPSWVGDAVMATPTLRALRAAHPGAFIGALVRPGIDRLLAGLPFVDEFHVERGGGVMGPKHLAAKVRPRRYDTALLLTNSFSTALSTRLAGIPRRVGYNRDLRGALLTDAIDAPKRPDGRFAPVPAVGYYLTLARAFLLPEAVADETMELAQTPEQQALASDVLARANVSPNDRFVVLNPGGNRDSKRWPPDRFAEVGRALRDRHGLRTLVNGSPAEAELTAQIAAGVGAGAADLAACGISLDALKGVIARAALMVTNDTGPRHIAAAFGVPLVSLFGPTDPRWTTITTRPGRPEAVLVADPTLPQDEVADDHPERCRVDRIDVGAVLGAAERVLSARG